MTPRPGVSVSPILGPTHGDAGAHVQQCPDPRDRPAGPTGNLRSGVSGPYDRRTAVRRSPRPSRARCRHRVLHRVRTSCVAETPTPNASRPVGVKPAAWEEVIHTNRSASQTSSSPEGTTPRRGAWGIRADRPAPAMEAANTLPLPSPRPRRTGFSSQAPGPGREPSSRTPVF